MALKDTIPDDVHMLDTHEYVKPVDEGVARIGITEYAAEQLGDIVFVELPDPDETFEKGESFGSIESVKASSELYMPVSGTITAINGQLEEEPGTINDNPFGSGWLIEVELSNPDELGELMDAQQYLKFLEESD